MSIITVGIDLAKNVFAVHDVNETGKAERVKPRVSRNQLLPLIASLQPCVIGMEARSGTPLGAPVFSARLHRKADGTEIRRPVAETTTD